MNFSFDQIELRIPRVIAHADFLTHVRAARRVKLMPLNSDQDTQSFLAAVSKWREEAAELLERAFDSPACARNFLTQSNFPSVPSLPELAERGKRLLQFGEGYLRMAAKRHIEPQFDTFIEESNETNFWPATPVRPSNNPAVTDSSKIFIVHGRGEYNDAVARMVEKLELTAVILQEQAGGGRTLIEKIEHYGDVGYAIVIMSPDDVGALGSSPELRQRARQNVVFELGYFVGRLGRGRVALLHFPAVEMPSDYSGVEYISYDSSGAWRFKLGEELRHAGYDIDLNRLGR